MEENGSTLKPVWLEVRRERGSRGRHQDAAVQLVRDGRESGHGVKLGLAELLRELRYRKLFGALAASHGVREVRLRVDMQVAVRLRVDRPVDVACHRFLGVMLVPAMWPGRTAARSHGRAARRD